MLISAEAAATSLNSYITFKEQLKPILKGGNTAAALNTLAAISESSQPYSAASSVKRGKRSKTSFDHHNQSLTSSSVHQVSANHHFLSTRRDSLRMANDISPYSVSQYQPNTTQQHSRESSLSVKPKKAKKQRSITISAVDGKENERLLEVRHQFCMKNDVESIAENKESQQAGCRASADTQAVTVAAPMNSMCSLQNVTNTSLTGRSLAARASMGVINPKNSSQFQVIETVPQTSSHNIPSQQALQQLLDTHQDLGIMSIYDQSDAKSQAQTNNAEMILREENMMLRMEILKLKKALFMKSQNISEDVYPSQQVSQNRSATPKNPLDQYQERTQSDAIFLSNVDERGVSCDHEEGHIKHSAQQESSRKQTPLARVGSNGILEEVGSSYNNSEVPTSRHIPRFQDTQNQHPGTFQSHQAAQQNEAQLTFNKSEFLGRHCMSTVVEQREENNDTTNKEIDDLEKFLRDQGIKLGNATMGSGNGRNFEQPKSGLSSSVYEQKRHYEIEIECLKKDLEAIEMEEQNIRQRLSEQSTIFLEQQSKGNERRGSERSYQNQVNRQSIEQMNQYLLKPINVAFDSFLEKRDQQFTGILSPIDHASAHRISDDAPLVLINHHLEQSANPNSLPSWQPPSFSNSHQHSLKVSPNLKETSQATVPAPHFVQAPFKHQEHQPFPKQQVVIIPELTLNQVIPTIKGRARRSRYSQRNLLNNIVSGMNSDQSDKDTQKQASSSRLNTEQIDQMFEDPNVQSQFHRLDTDEQPVVTLLNIKRDEDNETPLITEYIDQQTRAHHKKHEQEQDQDQLLNIKQSLKGVLHKYELSFQKPVQTSHESNNIQQNYLGIPRLSTIKEDSPDFGFQHPISENSDIVNHKSIIVNGKIKTGQRQKSANQTSHKAKQTPTQFSKNPSKSPKRPIKSANQVHHYDQKKKAVKKQTSQIPLRTTSPYNSSSVSSINQINHILNQAYMDIVKRKQKEILENRYMPTRISNPMPSMLPNPQTVMKMTTKQTKSKASKKVASKSKENIKYLSNIINKKEPSRNLVEKNSISNNQKQSNLTQHVSTQNMNHLGSTSQHVQFIAPTSNHSKSPKPASQPQKRRSKASRSRSRDKSPLKLEDQQYDLLWSKQVVQKRMTLMRQKEDSLRKKIEDKMSRIEEFTRRKELEKVERKNRSKSKSPGNNGGVVVTTMSEFECTPYNQSKMMLFERHGGFNTMQPSATQSSAVRSPRQQNMKVNLNKVKDKESCQNYYSCLPSGITTNLMSKQNSDRKNKTQEVESESTPVTVNKNWDQYENGNHNGGSFMSGTNHHRLQGIDPNITSSTSTVVVTANNCQMIESQTTLRNTFKMSLKSSTQHSRSNSISRPKTQVVNHKKQNSLSNPKTEQVLTLNRSQTQSLIAAPIGYLHNTKKIKRDTSPIIIIGDSDMMRQFLSNPSQKATKLKKFIMSAQDKETTQGLIKLQKIQCNSQLRLLEPIVEDI